MRRRSLEDWFWQVGGDVLIVAQTAGASVGMRQRFWEPRADLFEDELRFIVRVELAGVSPTDIQIVYLPDRHSLLIRGVRVEDDLPGGPSKGCHQLEIYFGEFEREVRLPEAPVEPEGMKARYGAGFLYVLIPKARSRVQHVRIRISND